MNGWRKVVGGLLTGILLLIFGMFTVQWGSLAADEDVEANKKALAVQENKCWQRHREVVEMNHLLGSIDTSLKILLPGYKEARQ